MERSWSKRVSCKIVFQPLHPDTGAPLHEERVITVREEAKLRPEFHLQDVTDGTRSPWISCSLGVKEFPEVVNIV